MNKYTEIEHIFLTDPGTAYAYAYHIRDHVPWPEFEEVLLKWAAEQVQLSKHPNSLRRVGELCFKYARYIKNEPWPESEIYMKYHYHYWDKYEVWIADLVYQI